MLQERLKKEILVFDGAMGTQLQAAKLKAGEIPEYLNITDPNLIQKIHLDYLNAGANFITTNTFGANPLKLKDFKKQATKAGYIIKTNKKQLRVDGKPVWFDEYSKEAMRSLNVDSIVERELTPVETDGNLIEGIFDNKGAL